MIVECEGGFVSVGFGTLSDAEAFEEIGEVFFSMWSVLLVGCFAIVPFSVCFARIWAVNLLILAE